MSSRLDLRILFDGDDRLGPGKIRLLELIEAEGSISAAGRAMDMSYRRAWLLVESLNRSFRDAVVEARPGGRHGGGAALTAFGRELVTRYRAMEEAAAGVCAGDLRFLEANRATVAKE